MERSDKTIGFLVLLCLAFFQGKAQREEVRDLDFFLKQGLSTSPLLKDARNQQLSNRIDSMRLRAGYLPQVTASSTGLYAPLVHGYGYDQTLTNGQALEALLTVNYTIVSKARMKNQLQAVKLQSDSLSFAASWSELDLNKTITDQYLTAFASQQQMEFNQQVYELLKQEEVILKKLTRANTYKQTEYLTFLVAFQQQQLQWKQAVLQFKNDYSMLNYLTGIRDTIILQLKPPVIESRQETNRDFFTQRFKLDSLKQENSRTGVSLDYQPRASIYANGGYNSSFVLQPYKNFGTSIGFTLSIPIYDGHQKKMQFSKISIQQQTTAAYKDFFIRQHEQQISLLNTQLKGTRELYLQINEQIRFTRSLIEADSRLMHTGDVRIADYIIAINNYLAAQNLSRQTNTNRLKLINQLNYWNR